MSEGVPPIRVLERIGVRDVGFRHLPHSDAGQHSDGDRVKYVWDGDLSIGLTYESWCYDVPGVAVGFPSETAR